jgi:FkbM family methyltransferase
MLAWIRSKVIGSPLERIARGMFIRLDPSQASRYDRLTLAVMRRCLCGDSNCIDIGAHRGAILAEILRRAPHGKHYAFEPLPTHAAYLKQAFPTVSVHQLALSDKKQQTTFVHDVKQPTRSGFARENVVPGETETITVQTDLLDNIVPANVDIRFVKIDVEGAEHQVLLGAVQTIRRNKPVIVFEYTHASASGYDIEPSRTFRFLADECGLDTFHMEDWLKSKTPLTEELFRVAAMGSRSIYFVAAPRRG